MPDITPLTPAALATVRVFLAALADGPKTLAALRERGLSRRTGFTAALHGLVHLTPGGDPDRHVYTLTAAGRAAMRGES